jgi:hypothetical protein
VTLYGWDASHYDGLLARGTLARARSEGIAFFTHKIAEGLQDTEGTGDDTALAAARDAGIEFVGGYHVVRSNVPVSQQVRQLIALADAGEPWWRDFPGWFWQVDLERWPYDNVPASVGIELARQLRDATSRWTIIYASHGQYGDSLAAWDGPLWNAHYVGHTATGFTAMYPGDRWRPASDSFVGGWAPYSGREPTFLQYTSSATIAGLTTCDANAFRGTTDELRALITGGDDVGSTEQVFNIDAHTWAIRMGLKTAILPGDAPGTPVEWENPLWDLLRDVQANVAADLAEDKATTAALKALTDLVNASGGNVDAAPILAAIADARAAESVTVTNLQQQVTDLLHKLAVAQRAAADQLES